jgi:hypothetical protein
MVLTAGKSRRVRGVGDGRWKKPGTARNSGWVPFRAVPGIEGRVFAFGRGYPKKPVRVRTTTSGTSSTK